jgi:hypothetical protein
LLNEAIDLSTEARWVVYAVALPEGFNERRQEREFGFVIERAVAFEISKVLCSFTQKYIRPLVFGCVAEIMSQMTRLGVEFRIRTHLEEAIPALIDSIRAISVLKLSEVFAI